MRRFWSGWVRRRCCLKRVLYPRITLPDGWREVVPTNQAHWADEDVAYSEFFGVPVGELIACS
jgi:hypothetical protein